MKKITLFFATMVALGIGVFYSTRTYAAASTGPLLQFTLHQTSTIQSPLGEAHAFQRTVVQQRDGTHANTEASFIQGAGRCVTGGIFLKDSRVTFNTCTQAKSTFLSRGEVDQLITMRKLTSCEGHLSGKNPILGSMFGLKTEEYTLDNPTEKGRYVLSPDLACASLSETHQWKDAKGQFTGAVSLLATTSVSAAAETGVFTMATNMKEMKPSVARNLWAAKLGRDNAPKCFQAVNAKLDQRYVEALSAKR